LSTKTIISKTHTIHVPAPNFEPPLRLDLIEIPPGTPVDLDEAEADRLIASGIAKERAKPVVEAAALPECGTIACSTGEVVCGVPGQGGN
jgi:hypothetical protein